MELLYGCSKIEGKKKCFSNKKEDQKKEEEEGGRKGGRREERRKEGEGKGVSGRKIPFSALLGSSG